MKVSATAVRVPVYGGHSESVNIEFKNDISIDKIIETLKNTEGVKVTNYTCPNEVKDREYVYVSRIRKDHTQDNTINLWIVADNIMKGAALNAIQIAEYINNKFIISYLKCILYSIDMKFACTADKKFITDLEGALFNQYQLQIAYGFQIKYIHYQTNSLVIYTTYP